MPHRKSPSFFPRLKSVPKLRGADHPEPVAGTAAILSAMRVRRPGSQREYALPTFPDRIAGPLAVGCEAGLDAAALLFFPLLVLLPRGIAALASAAGLCAAGLLLSAGRGRLSSTLGFAAMLLACLVFWGAVSALWSVNPTRSLAMALRLAGLFGAGLALAAAAGVVGAPRRLTFFLLSGLALGLALAVTDLATAGGLSSFFSDRTYRATRLNQASISFAILLLPSVAALVSLGRSISASLLAAAVAATVCALAGTTAKAALIAGLPVGVLLYRSRRHFAQAAAVISLAVIIFAPLTFAPLERVPGLGERADAVKVSAGHRLLIWSFAGDRIAEHPLSGWGLDSSRAIPGGDDPIRAGETWLPLHPHNAALQLWLELGVPGAASLALLLALLWGALASAAWPRLFAAASGGALATGLVGCFASYGIWQEWWLGTLWFSLFAILVMARAATSATPRRLPSRSE
jgi:exopolysaccharide production protein ExoQ